jgi:hypothetical protein
MSSLRDLVGDMIAVKSKKPALDGCGGKDKKEEPAFDSAGNYALADIKVKAISMVQQWTECGDDLEAGETCADRLMAMVIGIADSNKDGEISDDEQEVIDIALNYIWDYLEKYGAEESDISALLNDWDADAGERIKDLLAASLPEGDTADSEVDDFAFSDQDAVFDAVYKKAMVVRGGKKVRINKRISGTVRLSARQKAAIRKAGFKSHSAAAQMRRMKSMKVRKNSGL